MSSKINNKRSFTLIEMLVVVVVILILVGMVFKMMKYARNFQERAACVAKLEKIAYALNEYRAEYGQFPPVDPHTCIDPANPASSHSKCNVGGCARFHDLLGFNYRVHFHPTDCRTCYAFPLLRDKNTKEIVKGNVGDYYKYDTAQNGGSYRASNEWHFGLTSYLEPRYRGMYMDDYLISNSVFVSPLDTPRDLIAKKRWSKFLEGAVFPRDWKYPDEWTEVASLDSGGWISTNHFEPAKGLRFSLAMRSVVDPWHNVIRYRSDPPYQTYELWSPGPDHYDGDGSWPGETAAQSASRAKDNIHKSGKWDD